MRGRGVRLRGADWQAENMAVPFAIYENPMLRVPEDDLCRLKRFFRFVKEFTWLRIRRPPQIRHRTLVARTQHAFSSWSRPYSPLERFGTLGESCDSYRVVRSAWFLKGQTSYEVHECSGGRNRTKNECAIQFLLSSYIISLCYPEYNFSLSLSLSLSPLSFSFFFLFCISSSFFFFFKNNIAGALYGQQQAWRHVEWKRSISYIR